MIGERDNQKHWKPFFNSPDSDAIAFPNEWLVGKEGTMNGADILFLFAQHGMFSSLNIMARTIFESYNPEKAKQRT